MQFATATLDQQSAAEKELEKAFQINPCLLGLCNLPINTAIVLYLLQLQTPYSKLPSTQTGLFVLASQTHATAYNSWSGGNERVRRYA